jgi:ribosome-associated toxin RatA of RatAB toxin-antitoxin module
MKALLAIMLLAGMASHGIAAETDVLWNNLTEVQQSDLLAGKTVETEENVEGSAWPRFRVYQLVKAEPKSIAAVFWDCRRDPEYIPNCTAVTILSHPSPSVIEASYTLAMPFLLPDEVYVSKNVLRKPSETSYEITWNVSEARYTKSAMGSLRIEPHGQGSILRYANLVIPGSRIAGLLRATAGSQVVESVKALTRRVERMRDHDRTTLAAEEETLARDLEGTR